MEEAITGGGEPNHGAAAAAAKRLGLAPDRLSRIRRGQVPGIDVLLRIRNAYGIPIEFWSSEQAECAS